MKFFLDFEAEIAELEARINELRHVSNVKGTKILDEISNLEFKTKKLLKAKYSSLSPWSSSSRISSSASGNSPVEPVENRHPVLFHQLSCHSAIPCGNVRLCP